jgi:hypothetical protein
MEQVLDAETGLNSRIIFSSALDSEGSRSSDWDTLTIRRDQGANWVTITRTTDTALFRDEVEKLRALVKACVASDLKRDVLMCLQETRQLFLLHINHPEVPADGWGILDKTESYLAGELNGVIYAPGEGFFDSHLRPMPLLPAESVILPIRRPQ